MILRKPIAIRNSFSYIIEELSGEGYIYVQVCEVFLVDRNSVRRRASDRPASALGWPETTGNDGGA
jgi:hypothetical protein